jgi:(p)ppGpp synthase/HD superfamily hydrolase
MDVSLYRGFDNRAHKFFKQLQSEVDQKDPDKDVLRRLVLRETKRCLPLNARDEIRLGKVFNFSFDEHKSTELRDSGEAYIFHLVRAMLIMVWAQQLFKVYDLEVIVDIILHDCFEEDWATVMSRFLIQSRVAVKFGLETASDVYSLTKHKERGETNEAYCLRVATSTAWRVVAGKIIDRTDNMWTIGAVSPERRRRKILETEQWFQFICKRLFELIDTETERGKLSPSEAWRGFAKFIVGYLWFAVDEKRCEYKI